LCYSPPRTCNHYLVHDSAPGAGKIA
jgi:hypothetical protein